MYDVYHWEAHPDYQHPEPTTLEQRVSHYEDYLQQFPNVVWPGLVEEPVTNQLSKTFGLFQNYWGDQTYLVVIDAKGKIAYQNSFPLGSNNISNVYNDIDDILPSLMAETSINKQTFVKPDIKVDIIRSSNLLKLKFPMSINSNISIHTISGKKIYSRNVNSKSHELKIDNFASGSYLLNIETLNGTITKTFILE